MARATEEETQAALSLFNAGLDRQKAERKAEQRVRKAENAKKDAATLMKRLSDDPNASAEDKAAADAAYREALDAWNRAKNGEAEPETAPDETSEEAAPAADAAADDEPASDQEAAPADDVAAAEASSPAEEPAPAEETAPAEEA